MATLVLGACGGDDGGAIPDAGPDPTADAAGPLPTASVAFPAMDSVQVHGDRYPMIVTTVDASVPRLDVVVDGAVVAGGTGVPMLWRSTATSSVGGAASVEAIAAEGSFEFVVPARMTQKVLGLGDADTGGVAADIDVGFYFTLNTFNLVGAGAGVRPYESGDRFRLDVTATSVVWFHNDVRLAMGTRPSGALHAEAWLPGAGAAIADARITNGDGPSVPVTWMNLVATTAGTGFAATWSSLARPDGDLAIAARATNTTGASADSTPVTIAVDNTAPTCALVSPTGGTVSGTVTLAGQGGDAHLVTLAFFVDGRLHSQHDGQATASSAWDTTAIPDGAHAVELRAYDNAFHSVACPTTVTVDNP